MRKTAIITGASTGIGKTTAKAFIDAGYNVVINSANGQNLKAAYESFGSPASVVQVVGDVSHKETGIRLAQAAIEHFGRVDVLVNNAGVFAPKPFLDVDEDDLDTFYSVNLKGTYFTTQAVIKEMLAQGKGGSIINIGTVLTEHAIAGFPATAPLTSKGGIHALSKQLAAEFAKDNIRVNVIAPGIIRSPLQGKIGVENADGLAGLHLLNRIGEPEHVASAALYLADNDFVTGDVLNVDGGHVAGHLFG